LVKLNVSFGLPWRSI